MQKFKEGAIVKINFFQFLYKVYKEVKLKLKKILSKKEVILYKGHRIQMDYLDYSHYADRLKKYIERVDELPEDKPMIIMFSGTTFIQEEKANRPIRLTKIFIERGIPVLFSYYRADRCNIGYV